MFAKFSVPFFFFLFDNMCDFVLVAAVLHLMTIEKKKTNELFVFGLMTYITAVASSQEQESTDSAIIYRARRKERERVNDR